MRIAFLVHDLNRSWGHSRYVAELAERFSQEHEVHVYANTFQLDSGLARVVCHHIPAWRQNAFTTILTFLITATLWPRRGFSIVHSQGLCGLGWNVVTAHQCNREWFEARRRQAGRLGWRERLFAAVITALEHLGYRFNRSRHVIAISQRIASDLQRHYGCQAPLAMIHHGTDTALFRPDYPAERTQLRQQWGAADDQFVFLFLGDLRKGARQTIEAMRHFSEAKLVLVSRSEPAEWQRLAASAGLADRVVFAGPTEHAEHCYAAADAFLLPTPYDPFALVASEAMCASLPVVVSCAAGAAELINDGHNGLILHDPNNVEELTEHMRRLLGNPAWARALGEAARRSQENCTWDQVARHTMRVYRQQLARERRSAVSAVPEEGLSR